MIFLLALISSLINLILRQCIGRRAPVEQQQRVRDDVRSDDTAHQRHEIAEADRARTETASAAAGTGRDAPNPADAPVHAETALTRILRDEMLQFGGRARGVPALVSLILVALAAASSDLFDNQLGDINYCKKQCQMSIKNKSPAKVSATYQMLLH